jgi:hypothetical protein
LKAISFESKFVDQIRSGRKKSTVRRGIKVYRRGESVDLVSNGKVFKRARIIKVVVKRVSELTDKDAELDGFSTRDELLKELKKIYGDIKEGDLVSVIYFDVGDESIFFR